MGFASLQPVHPLWPAYHLFVGLAGPVLSRWKDLATVETWHQAGISAGPIQVPAGRGLATEGLVPLETTSKGPIAIVPTLLWTVDKGLAAEVHGSLEQAAGAISYHQFEDRPICLVFVQEFVLVGLSCEASSTHHIPPCTLYENLLHKLHAIRVAASTIPLLRLAAEVNLFERK